MLHDIETQSACLPGLSDFKISHVKAGHVTEDGTFIMLNWLGNLSWQKKNFKKATLCITTWNMASIIHLQKFK